MEPVRKLDGSDRICARIRIFPGHLSAGSRTWFVPDKILNKPELVQTKSLLSALPADAHFACRKNKAEGETLFSTPKLEKAGPMELTQTGGLSVQGMANLQAPRRGSSGLGWWIDCFLVHCRMCSCCKTAVPAEDSSCYSLEPRE